MAPKLTDEQRHAIEQQGGRPVEIVDPSTHTIFYLISGDQFNQLRSLLESEAIDIRETYAAQDRALRSVWDDPALDVYNDPDGPSTSP
jgi:hypothetical protein